MKHVAATVLLLAIAGAPVTTLLCIGWCAPGGVPGDVSCHHERSGAGLTVTTGNDTCAGLLSTSPYLKEEVQLIATAMLASAPYAISSAAGEAQLVTTPDVVSAIPQRMTSPVVLRL